jgi:hypothetical protein
MAQWQSGGLQTHRMLVRTQAVLFGFLWPCRMNVNLRRLECFTSYLRNSQSGNLRAIENCICGLRSIERKMTAFLRTVYLLVSTRCRSRSRSITLAIGKGWCQSMKKFVHPKLQLLTNPQKKHPDVVLLQLGPNPV